MNWKKLNFSPELDKLLAEYENRVVVYSDRDFYDFFDEQGIKIGINYHIEDDSFQGYIYQDKTTLFTTEVYPTRKKAEDEVFEQAFRMLENKLKKAKPQIK